MEKNVKWTPGPWKFGSVITAENCVGIAQIIDNPEWPNGEVEANSHRIVACVNACEGIEDPSVVPAIMRGLRLLKEVIDGDGDRYSEKMAVCQLLTSLDRAEGRK